ncbi:MAG: phosphomannomutase [Desulfovibrio sp.]|nr:phosphomannomutase [Desulfovibrio sp.]
MSDALACFKAYDIRGKFPKPLSPELAYALGLVLAKHFAVHKAIIGHDIRLSGPALRDALASGLTSQGAEVTFLGLSGTEEVYYAASHEDADIGIMITGSHNPADENGFKLVRRGAIPISNDSGLLAIREEVDALLAKPMKLPQALPYREPPKKADYLNWLVQTSGIKEAQGASRKTGFKVLACAGNGSAGPLLARLAPLLPFELIVQYGEADGHFPHGVPNPLLPERRKDTQEAVLAAHADLGVAFDGDFDRCFFFDAKGQFIEGYYLVGLLAKEILRTHPGQKIVHDPRLYWNTQAIVRKAGGIPVLCKTGHAFIKERMRREDAVYGGEMSAHHYFRDFNYCDSGMLPFLLVTNLLLLSPQTLEEMVASAMADYPCSGEINRKVADPGRILESLRALYVKEALHEDQIDGLSLEFRHWRFNLRMSNTEPLLRLNVESRADLALMQDKTQEILAHIEQFAN